MNTRIVQENGSSEASTSKVKRFTKIIDSANRLSNGSLQIGKVTLLKSQFLQMKKCTLVSDRYITETHSNPTPLVQSKQAPINARAQEKQDSESPLPNQMYTDGTNQQFSLVLEALARITQTVEHNTIKLQALSDELTQCANTQKQILEKLKELPETSIAHRKISAKQNSSGPGKGPGDIEIRMDLVDSPNTASMETRLLQALKEQQQLPTAHGKSLQSVNLKPVECLEDLEELEKLAKSKNFVQSVAQFVMSLFPEDFEGTGRTYCHRIVDLFFTRSFMMKCSWTGKSNSGIQKYGLRFFPHVVYLFISVVQYAYPEFTEKEGLQFLRRCMGDAKTRFHEIQRASTARKKKEKINATQDQPKRKKPFRPMIKIVESNTEPFEIDPLMIEPQLDELDIPNGKPDPVQVLVYSDT